MIKLIIFFFPRVERLRVLQKKEEDWQLQIHCFACVSFYFQGKEEFSLKYFILLCLGIEVYTRLP